VSVNGSLTGPFKADIGKWLQKGLCVLQAEWWRRSRRLWPPGNPIQTRHQTVVWQWHRGRSDDAAECDAATVITVQRHDWRSRSSERQSRCAKRHRQRTDRRQLPTPQSRCLVFDTLNWRHVGVNQIRHMFQNGASRGICSHSDASANEKVANPARSTRQGHLSFRGRSKVRRFQHPNSLTFMKAAKSIPIASCPLTS
jgi:hypothetical protein